MALSFSRPDPSSPDAVAGATFSTGRRGFDQNEVRDFLRMVAAELARLQERERYLERELRTAQRGAPNPAVALDEEVVTRMLGEEAARILATSREAATQIKVRAEEASARIVGEAADEAQRVREEAQVEAARRRQDAAADAESELEMAKQQGREMVNEARAYRERVLTELSRRRELARQQIEQLVHGRDRLVQAFERARLAAVDVMSELTPIGEPNEYVNLSPTTGPVPVMLPNTPRPPEPERPRMAFGADDVPDVVVEEPAEAVEPPAVVAEVVVDEIVVEDVAVDEVAAAAVEEQAAEELAAEEAAAVDEVVVAEVVVDEIVEVAADVDDVDAVVEAADVEPEIETSAETHSEAEEVPAEEEPRVVSLFAGEMIVEEPTEAPASAEGVDDLFARLRAARAESVAERARLRAETPPPAPVPADDDNADATRTLVRPDRMSVFEPSPVAPPDAAEVDDSPFGRRDAALTPLIVTAARKLKRVLADEQNDVLHALRRTPSITALEPMLPSADEHGRRYADVIATELAAAAVAGAASLSEAKPAELTKRVRSADATAPAVATLIESIVAPLRDRMYSAVTDAGGDNTELAALARGVYREWKVQHIDERLDEVVRVAFGRGALAGVDQGTPVKWTHDPRVPVCADCDDNALSGVIGAGEPFATGQPCAPAHTGCRCMLATDGG